MPLDVTKEQYWKSAIATIESKLGPLDVCCNNAGTTGIAPMGSGTDLTAISMNNEGFTVELNEISVIMGCKYAALSMKQNDAKEWK